MCGADAHAFSDGLHNKKGRLKTRFLPAQTLVFTRIRRKTRPRRSRNTHPKPNTDTPMTAPMYTLLALAFLLANLPFLTPRLFGLKPLPRKHAGHHLIELAAAYALTVALAYLLESRTGPVHPQGWEFYAVTVCLFAVAAFPGFVWRYFWKDRDKQ